MISFHLSRFFILLYMLHAALVFAESRPSRPEEASEPGASFKKQLGAPSALSRQFADRVSKASMLLGRGNGAAALEEIDLILQRWPAHAPALVVKSRILSHQNNGLDARSAARAAIESDPNWKEGYSQLASLLLQHGKQLLHAGDAEGAYESFRQILLIDLDVQVLSSPTLSQVHDGIGQALHAAGMPDVAIENLEKAISLHSNNIDALFRLSNLLVVSGADENKTISIMQHALAQRFDLVTWVHVLRWQFRHCDWSNRHQDLQTLASVMAQVSPHSACPISPESTLDFPLPASVITACARSAAAAAARTHRSSRNASSALAAWQAFEDGDRRLSIALLAGAVLSAEKRAVRLLQAAPEAIDRRWFRVLCVELDPALARAGELEGRGNLKDSVRARLRQGCDEFISASSGTAGLLGSDRDVHVLLDISGHESEASIKALATGQAQIQVSWQGYPGTVGGSFVPYLSSDPIASPPEMQSLYCERLLYAPGSYLLSSHSRSPAETVPVWADADGKFEPPSVSRKLFGLPTSSFIFAFFGDAAAIDPAIWMAWMEILRIAKRSCLWLVRARAEAEAHLHAHALEYGIHSSRIIFSDPFPPHLEEAAMALADLYLDSRQRSSAPHTIFSALHASLPVLTLPGDTLHRRSSASILLGTPVGSVLVARTLEDYETIAVALAASSQRHALRARLSLAKEDGAGIWDLSKKVAEAQVQWRMLWDAEMIQDGPVQYNLVVADRDRSNGTR